MYHPDQNENFFQNTQQPADPHTESQQPTAPSGGQTAQPSIPTESAPQPSVPQPAERQENPAVTYHTGPVHAGSAYIPTQSAPYSPPQQQPRTGYTWNPSGAPQAGTYSRPAGTPYPNVQQASPYYAPVQPKKKRNGGKLALKILAAVLCCAVISFGSVGAFALMIQNGVVDVESPSDANQTAAFTIYKQAESSGTATPTVTGETLTAQEVAKKLIPSVVCVQNYRITQQGGFFYGFGYGYDDDDEAGVSPAGEGSGIIISKDGYIVTNQHVVDGATSLKVVTSEGRTYEAELVGEDTQTDLAVIKIDTEDELTPAEFGSSEDLEVADDVMAIGNPGGLQLNSSVTFGRISALNREITNSETGYSMKCIQTDAAINPGNSGGALVDMNGHVVGINSSKIAATEYEGLGFAIPSDTAQPIVSDLIEHGYVKDRPMLGISGSYVDQLTASFYGVTPGYYVAQVNSSEAQKAGLQRGDVITAIDETQVTSSSTITNYLANKKPGDTVTLTVDHALSGENGIQIDVVLSENTGKSS